jgi:pimeloyl-ACP methyl ester carboxylesterase
MSIFVKHLHFLKSKMQNKPKSNHPLFVFLPGLDGTGRLLENQLEGLDVFFEVCCLSIPSDDLTDWSGLVEQTTRLLKAESRRGTTRSVYLCGESFGGCLALKLAAHSPELFDRMILINPASSFSRQPLMSFGASITQWLPDSLYRISTLGLLPFLIARQRVSRQSRRALLTAMQSVKPESAAWRLALLNQFTLEELPLQQISQPVLVIASEADRLLPSGTEADRLVHYLPNARKTLLPNSGHACLLEREIKLAGILRSQDFLLSERSEGTADTTAR